jgi:hypothetical protein
MATPPCEHCGHQADGEAVTCPGCGHPLKNGTVQRLQGPVQKPPPPPEVAGWVIYQTPPEILEEMRRTFNREEFLAELRQAEQAGLPELKDLIRDLEQEMTPRD